MNRDRINDNELMRRIAAGDKVAFETLYHETSKKVFFYLLRLLNSRQSAEDIHMETYTQVWKNAGTFKGRAKAATWIFSIARNQAFNEMRRKGNLMMQDFSKTMKDNKSHEKYNDFHRHRFIQHALSRLSIKHREVMDLVFYHEMTYQEVSRILEVSENTVKTRMFYAKKALRKTIGTEMKAS